jgi:hypothetical protein
MISHATRLLGNAKVSPITKAGCATVLQNEKKSCVFYRAPIPVVDEE